MMNNSDGINMHAHYDSVQKFRLFWLSSFKAELHLLKQQP